MIFRVKTDWQNFLPIFHKRYCPTGAIVRSRRAFQISSKKSAELVRAEGARVSILNGSYTAGLAARTTEYLQSQGVNVVETGNSEQYATYTEITFHTGKPYTIKYLVDLMQISEFRIRHFFDPASSADIVIILGDDWAANNPMP